MILTCFRLRLEEVRTFDASEAVAVKGLRSGRFGQISDLKYDVYSTSLQAKATRSLRSITNFHIPDKFLCWGAARAIGRGGYEIGGGGG